MSLKTILQQSLRRLSEMITSSSEISCESTVAQAAPATPIFSVPIITKSRTMLERHPTIRKYSGLLLSPKALKIPAPMLYMTTMNPPRK